MTLVDYKTDMWQDEYGYMWSTTQYGPYIVDTVPMPIKDADPVSQVMKRTNSNFDGMIIHETSMPASYENLRNYLKGHYPGCSISVIYEAGFSGFWFHDFLKRDGIDFVVTPPNKVTMEKDNRSEF